MSPATTALIDNILISGLFAVLAIALWQLAVGVVWVVRGKLHHSHSNLIIEEHMGKCFDCKHWRLPWSPVRGFWGECLHPRNQAVMWVRDAMTGPQTSDTMSCGGFSEVTEPDEIVARRNWRVPPAQ